MYITSGTSCAVLMPHAMFSCFAFAHVLFSLKSIGVIEEVLVFFVQLLRINTHSHYRRVKTEVYLMA